MISSLEKSSWEICRRKIIGFPLRPESRQKRVSRASHWKRLEVSKFGERRGDLWLRITCRTRCSTEIRISTVNYKEGSHFERSKGYKNKFNNGEFDPGSGWTLATGLTHASRGAAICSNTKLATGARVSNAYATCPQQRDNSAKVGLIPHNTGTPHGDIC